MADDVGGGPGRETDAGDPSLAQTAGGKARRDGLLVASVIIIAVLIGWLALLGFLAWHVVLWLG